MANKRIDSVQRSIEQADAQLSSKPYAESESMTDQQQIISRITVEMSIDTSEIKKQAKMSNEDSPRSLSMNNRPRRKD